jgi:hypothetical protein
LKRYFTKKHLSGIKEKYSTIKDKADQLILDYFAHRFSNEQAREYAHHGFGRRISTIRRCIDNVFRAVPPGTVKVPM